jgi:putative membrane protein
MKLNFFLLTAGVIFLMSCGSQSSENTTTGDSNSAKTDTTAKSDTASSVSDQDSKFAMDAATIGMMEIALGKVAQQNSSMKDVKEFGAMMVKDHTSAAGDLQRIADAKRIMLPTTLSADDQKKIDDMKAKTGKNFDKSYIDMMIDGHKKAADKFQDEINKGSNADLRAFATKTLDVIHAHLDSAQKCKAMEKGM